MPTCLRGAVFLRHSVVSVTKYLNCVLIVDKTVNLYDIVD